MHQRFRPLADRTRSFITKPVLDQLARPSLGGPDAAAQLLLRLEYQRLRREGVELPGPGAAGFKAYSQSDEDGILWYIFSLIGDGSKRCVEICAGNGIECTSANLLLNHGWLGLLVDGDAHNVAAGREFYATSPLTYVYPPRFEQAWITRASVNEVVSNAGFTEEIDLLTIDLDGVDWWIWDALTVVEPRVVVVEYQDILGPDRCVTVPYADDFDGYAVGSTQGLPNFAGASLAAFAKLGRSRGYRLVAINRYGYNAFFVRDRDAADVLPELAVADCFSHPKVVEGMSRRYPAVADAPWQEV